MSAHDASGRFLPRHGHCAGERSGTYKSWVAMVQRCTNPDASNYEDYGGRGISVCAGWLKFDQFLADVGERPDGTSLDRIDVNGDYEPGNVRWATASEQRANQRKPLVDLRGQRFERLTVIEFAGRNSQRNSLWRCACSCGQQATLPEYRLKNGTTKSCGCLCRELSAIRARELSRTRPSRRGCKLKLSATERQARSERMRAMLAKAKARS